MKRRRSSKTDPVQHTAGAAATHYAAMRRESTPRRWLLAGTLGAATGLLTHLVLPWPLALCAAVVTAAGLLVWARQHGTIADWWPGPHPPHRLAATAAHLERHGCCRRGRRRPAQLAGHPDHPSPGPDGRRPRPWTASGSSPT